MTQLAMFETEDLPLFSGTAPKGKIETFDPPPAHVQQSFTRCSDCRQPIMATIYFHEGKPICGICLCGKEATP